ncbi:MAG: SRPBCC family protein [Nitrososphaerota archaeon]|nr:SRPBCC family protein [Nitrososphaerota archaeon]MDG6978554.1 SRPBCC family protein [Nitrososphaerota archaeon]MDG7021223.1 SRPBCC family protein [Nitrososphaerota archaeon]MDG7022234.1 SRPBCC family protein [Nitrososphaerota archaeon]
MRLEVSRVVSAPCGAVFEAYTDFESMPRWSKRLSSVRVVAREGDTVRIETEGVSSKGEPRRREGSLRLTPPSRVESESETRFTKTRRVVTFEAAPGGSATKVTAALEVRVKGLWALALRPGVNKDAAEASARDELDSFATFVEGSSQPGKAGNVPSSPP